MRLIWTVLVLFAGQATAEPILTGTRDGASALPEGCRETSATTIISVLVCPSGLEDATLAEAGRAVCGAALPCGAWIWTDDSFAPPSAPENHDGLTKAQILSSRGVWIAEDEAFLTIAPVSE